MSRSKARLGCLKGGGKGGSIPINCENHVGRPAAFRVAIPGAKLVPIYLLCPPCAQDVANHFENVIMQGGTR